MVDVETPVNIEAPSSDISSQISTGSFSGPRHQLKYTWTLWYDCQLQNGKKATTWGDNMKEVYSFSNVEDFWRLYNNVALATQLQGGCSFNLFKKGIAPKWEDPKNEKGGRWTVLIPKNKNLDTLWLYLMLACIGQAIEEDDDQICGCVVNIRKGQDKMNLWTSDENNEAAVLKIGEKLKKALELAPDEKIGYAAHSESRRNKWEI